MKSKMRACSAATALVLLTLSGWSSAAGGTYYRWTDASGIEVNSDRPPPPGTEYETIATSTNERVDEVTDDGNMKPAETPSRGEAPEIGQAPMQRIVVEKNPEACALAKQNLETLNTHARIRIPDDEGNYRYLSEDEKTAERAKAEATIKQNCE
ncbi:MAG: DUF4124 domain-containing protein [Gammaproteobacteria bacterium]|nr:DUF4124 domain-containing protein [Gammaproteobacteria bacterium]